MRYALIDGTGAIDTVAFAKTLSSPFTNVLEALPRSGAFRLDNAQHTTSSSRGGG